MAHALDPVRTERLVLTPVGPDDLATVMILHSDPVVAHWTGPWTSESNTEWVRGMTRHWAVDGVGKWLARDRTDGSLVGRGGFTRFDLDGEDVLELGWTVRDRLTGRGYATEIGRAALAWRAQFFAQLPVIAFTEIHNLASRAVMQRLGLREVGVIRREGLVEGEPDLNPDAAFALYRQS